MLTLKANAIFPNPIRWSADGSTFGSLDKVGMIHLWRAPSWEEIEAMERAEAAN